MSNKKKCLGSLCVCVIIGCIIMAIAVSVIRKQNHADKVPSNVNNNSPSLMSVSPPKETGYSWLKPTAGGDNIRAIDNELIFSVDPPNKGCRAMSVWASMNGSLCADIATAPGINPGSVFAMYVITEEPQNRNVDKWWELDLEFLGKRPEDVWINVFSGGVADQTLEKMGNYRALPEKSNSGYHRYCINWDVDEKIASWYVDGIELYSYAMDGTWTKPMRAVISYWAGVAEWTGASGVLSRVSTHVKDIQYNITV